MLSDGRHRGQMVVGIHKHFALPSAPTESAASVGTGKVGFPPDFVICFTLSCLVAFTGHYRAAGWGRLYCSGGARCGGPRARAPGRLPGPRGLFPVTRGPWRLGHPVTLHLLGEACLLGATCCPASGTVGWAWRDLGRVPPLFLPVSFLLPSPSPSFPPSLCP